MVMTLQHAMAPTRTADEVARARFVSGLRSFILNDLAADLRTAYDRRAASAFRDRTGHLPADSDEVHDALRGDPTFALYTASRIEAQHMVWESVIPGVEREREQLENLARNDGAVQSVALDPDLVVPRNVSAIDVHLMPGAYSGAVGGSLLGPGAVYDRGLAIFSMGLMGANLDDIGLSMAAYIKARFPDFAPTAMLDVGCTIGHNSLPWKQAYPAAELHAADVAAPGLVYGAARAKLQGVDARFHQMNAEDLKFPNESFDLVFTSMFLHELSAKTRARFFDEAHRLLRPGGLLLNMELPPNSQMSAFDGFYLDWDCWYNTEPFYKGYRDEDPKALCVGAGFAESDYLQFVVPSIGIYGHEAVREAARGDIDVDQETTGRLADGVQWFGFGAWKSA
ncbi:class I SAM-dependent methyltransferase [Novosphingobium sp. Gsoil 351]|uniref:class I SAM-dependent methyltransferase n=1 Tax=Novosphingobium sp. Gsoil 351 TaxID=2675225 RepID=UPI0012B487B8|nr:class I SAM-dependent methyltransferase [Novosphingobium sp. Gsoil 351]QGN54478.1 methyltransferase domain-containing protein [Novosphingobium sp. Gsoil 351]